MPTRPGIAWRLLVLLALLAARAAPAAVPAAPLPSPQELEASGAIIGKVHIVVGDVFDTDIDGEDGWLYRTANKLHINTRPSVIRGQLLFKSGDPYQHRLVEETERLLRDNGYLYDAVIVPVAFDDGVVDLEVRTRDVWTLNPGLSFSRKGGENTFGANLTEDNLLGTGRSLDLAWDSNVDRESISVSYFDPHFRHSFTQFGVTYADADDGDTKLLQLNRPFYALDVRHAAGMYLRDDQRNESRYVLGDEIGEFARRDEYYEVYAGISRGLQGRWVRRWTAGVTYERDRFELDPDESPGGPLPEDRELVYPWIGFELVEDNFQERINQDQILRTEDVLVGLYATARLGFATESFGSATDAVLVSAYASNGIDLSHAQSLFGSAWASGRYEHGEIRNGTLGAEARYYLETSARSKFFADLSGTVTEQLDHDQQLTLGGDTGLRGYPFAYQAGTAKALLTLEQRYYTKWYPFRLFHVAGAVFADTGRTWGTDVTGATSLGLLSDVGIGLRLGTSRSAFGNVLHIDLAFPLDGDDDIDSVQLVVETKARF